MGSTTSSETTSSTISWKQKFILKQQAKKQKFIRDHEKGVLKYMKFMNALTTRLIDGRENRVCTAASIYDIEDMNLPGYRLHQLKGQKKDIWSITVNGNWRITFEFIHGDAYIVNYEDYH